MVMEAPPSPQSVGREFVRQYYTLLNKAPTHLHRFYNHQSSFVHGGLDPPNHETTPVIGQKQIHQKIQQLNFRDCHAKITQVDSQATLGNGVVVQVTGELSNAGQPMRRFTQTFVLAAQSPKKYYVHNDIFRYQDEIILDEGCEADGPSDVEEDVINDRPVMGPNEVQQPLSQPTLPQYYNPTPAAAAAQIPPPTLPQVPIHHNQQQHPQHVIGAQPPVPAVNGAIHPDDISNVIPNQGIVPSAPAQALPIQQNLVQNPMKPPSPVDDHKPQQTINVEENTEESIDGFEQAEIDHEQNLPMESDFSASNEPKTYANLLKSGNNPMPYQNQINTQPPLGQQQQPQQQPPQPRPTSPLGGGFGSRTVVSSNNINNRPSVGGNRINQQQQQQQPQPPQQSNRNRNESGRGMRNSINEDGSYEEKRRGQSQNFSDINQLFLGNLPHTATEDELKDIFSQYGNIIELRVLSKSANKMAPGGARAPPNYGFITYETEVEVRACLNAKPIYYPKNDVNGTMLNVEEKKTKDRPYGRSSDLNSRNSNRGGSGGGGGGNRNLPNRNTSNSLSNRNNSNNYNGNSSNNRGGTGGPQQGRGNPMPGGYRR